MPSAYQMIFDLVARDGASPAFRTVAAEAKSLAAAMADADAKMSAGARASSAEIDASLKTLADAHRATADAVISSDSLMVDATKASAAEMSAANEGLAASMAASSRALVEAQRAAMASSVEMGATIDRVSAEEAAATEASAAKRKASLASFGAASALALVGVAYYSVKAATTFEASMARVQTMAGASSTELKKMGDGVLALAPKVGIGPDQLAESLYHVESAGFRGSKALDMVAASAKLSALGQDDINSSTQAVVATLASNIKGVRDANDAAALILHTVGTGDMTMQQFTQALGTGMLSTAAAVGLSFRDVGAAIATLTDNAIPADQAATKLRTSLLMMVNPSGPAIAALSSIGMSSTALAGDLNKPDGLKTALDDIRTHLNNAFPETGGAVLSIGAQRTAIAEYRQELATAGVQGKELDKAVATYSDRLKTGTTNTVLQEQAFAKMFGGSRNAGTMLVLFNEQLDRMNPKLASYGDAASRAAEMQAAWAKQQDTFKQKLNDLGAAFDVMKVKIGNALLPVLKDFVDFLGSHIGLVETLAYAIGTVLVAATVAWTISLQLNPVVLLIEGLVALGAGIYELITHFREVTDFLSGTWGTAISLAVAAIFPFIGIPMLIIGHWHGLVDFFKGLWNDISDAFNHPGDFAAKLVAAVKAIPGELATAASDAVDWLKPAAGKAASGFWSALSDGLKAAGTVIAKLPGVFTAATSNAATWLWDAAQRAASGLWDGLVYGITHAYQIGERLGQAMGNAIGDLTTSVAHVVASINWGKVFTDAIKGIADWFSHVDWGHVVTAVFNGIQDALAWVWKNQANIAKIGAIIAAGLTAAVLAVPLSLAAVGAAIVAGITVGIYQASSSQRHAIGQAITDVFSTQVGSIFKSFAQHSIDQIQFMWRGIVDIFKISGGLVVGAATVVWTVTSNLFKITSDSLIRVVKYLWDTTVGLFKISSDAVIGIVRALWTVTYNLFKISSDLVIGIVRFLWNVAVDLFKNSADVVVSIVRTLWTLVYDLFKISSGAVIGVFTFLWSDLVDTATRIWHDIESPMHTLWDMLTIGFTTTVDAIKFAWDKLHDIFLIPINFFIDPVYNKGVVPVWNAVMDIVGEPNGKMHTIATLDAGGGLAGPARGDDRLAMVGGGEHMWTADEVKAAGGHERVAAIRSAVLGRPVRVMGDGSGSYFFGGGVLNDIGHAITHNPVADAAGSALHAITHNPVTDAVGGIVGDLTHMVRGATADVAAPALNGAVSLLDHLIGTGSGKWGHEVGQVGHHAVDKMIAWIRGQDQKDQSSMFGGADPNALLAYARQFINKVPYLWGGDQPTGWDCSGFTSYVYDHFGLNAPRTSEAQQAWAKPTGETPGALAFFGHPAYHVGLALGGGQMLDAAHSGTLTRQEGLWPDLSGFGLPPGGLGGGAASVADGGDVKAMVKQMAIDMGWGAQFGAIDYIVSHESSWNPNAHNGSSTASGLFQLLYNAGSNAHDQAVNGLNYIAQRYGDPNNAQAFWQSHGWYANGGMPPVGQPFTVGESGPETMVQHRNGALEVFSNADSHRMLAGSGSPLMHVENMNVDSAATIQLALAQAEFLRQTAGTF